jgi:hypothetical protein
MRVEVQFPETFGVQLNPSPSLETVIIVNIVLHVWAWK